MSVTSREIQKWKDRALNGFGWYKNLIEQLETGTVKVKTQSIEDLPPIIKINNILCKLQLIYNNNEHSFLIYYKNTETEETILETIGNTISDAVTRMVHRLANNKISSETDELLMCINTRNKEEWEVTKRKYKIKKIPDTSLHKSLCPYCDSDKLKMEHYRTSQESWDALAGREGYIYKCEECGYTWDECFLMS